MTGEPTEPAAGVASAPAGTLGSSLDVTIVEELVPVSARRPKRERGERPLLEVRGLRTSF